MNTAPLSVCPSSIVHLFYLLIHQTVRHYLLDRFIFTSSSFCLSVDRITSQGHRERRQGGSYGQGGDYSRAGRDLPPPTRPQLLRVVHHGLRPDPGVRAAGQDTPPQRHLPAAGGLLLSVSASANMKHFWVIKNKSFSVQLWPP